VSSAEGPEFAAEMKDFVEKLRDLGPSPLKKTEGGREAA
jgi:coenzyme F420-reducing hydrogenase delta subunit